MIDAVDLIGALRATLGKLEVALDSISEAIAWTGEDGKVQWCNTPLTRLLGRHRLAVLGAPLTDLLSLEQQGLKLPIESHPIRLTLVTGSPMTGTYELRRGDEPLCLEISGSCVHLGGTGKSAVFVIRDITQRKRAESKIVESQRELRDYIDHMSTLSAKIALDGTLLLVNRIAEQASGLPRGQLMNTNFLEGAWWAFEPEVQTRVRAAFQRATAGETINYDEKIFAFGKVITINLSFVPVRDERGQISYILAEGRDITAQKQAEEALRAANKDLEAFCYSVSHDLRAPLRAMDGFSRELLENARDRLDDRAKGDLDRIRAAAQRMAQLIDDLLNLSGLSRREMTQDEVTLSAHVQKMAEDLKSAHPERHVEFIIEPNLTVRGDSRLLVIALENLLSNAWKFTEKRTQSRIEFGMTDLDGERAFFVRDNGVGFDMAYAGKLFGVFQRLHDHNEYPGTGIGLATVQRIIDRHGGRVWAEAEENKGATFYFTLP